MVLQVRNPAYQRPHLKKEGKVGEMMRVRLIDDEVLRVHPLPAPTGA